jgi:lauroyl/myristoyl acyltransferase
MKSPRRLGHAIRNRVLRHFPRFSLRTLAILAHLRHRFPSALRRELELNLGLAFPALERGEITRLARSVLVTNLVDASAQFRLELLPREVLCREIMALRVTGGEHLERAGATGQPVILVTPHYGGFMQAALRVALGQREKPVCFFYNPSERNPYANTSDVLIDRMDDRCIKIHHDRKGVITALRALKKGGMLCLMPDQMTPEGETVYVPFHGRFFGVMQGVAFFALKANARILPLYCRTGVDGESVLEYRAPLAVPLDLNLGEEAQLYRITAALFSEMERQFLQAPTHWRYWTQFRGRSFASPVPPKSRSELMAQLEEVRRRVAGHPAEIVVSDWQKLLREQEAAAGGAAGL